MYLDPALHSAFTGAPVVVGAESGAAFSAFGGILTGTILEVAKDRLIVQSWRSTAFKEGDIDSTLILSFSSDGAQGQIDMIHLDVPDHDYQGVTDGWPKYYWGPWYAYLESQAKQGQG